MAVKNDKAPIIIKRKKVIKGGGHHGGAWKIAYADFVTAMMAFFLLMWLLNATTESQRKGLADYFSPTIPVFKISGGGDGAFGGESTFSQEMVVQNGTGAADLRATDENKADGDTGVESSDIVGGEDGVSELKFTDIENMFRGDSGESTVADDLLKHVNTRVTDEGLIIEVFDLPSSPLFVVNTGEPNDKMLLLLDMIADVIGIVSNNVAVLGHTDEIKLNGGDAFILSTERAHFSRQRLVSAGVSASRIARVAGYAARSPSQPVAGVTRNRRIEIILLRSERTSR
ncbi:MAG: chemotaxis protein MotB [Rhodobacteraceae bacterium]|nr:MAG: chemotaxis protein MotB [Paracoccaceae bacterium]